MTVTPLQAPPHSTPATPDMLSGGLRDQIRLPSDPLTVAGARHFIRHTLRRWRTPQDVTDTCVLLISELATEAITCGTAPTYTVTCTHRPSAIELTVSHADTTPAPLSQLTTAADKPGSGMDLIARIATARGSSRHHDGTRLWARLNLPTPSDPAH